MFAWVTFKRALIVVRLVGWLDTSKPHLTPAPWAWREINRLERIMNMRLLHSARSLLRRERYRTLSTDA
jgi:hypothetical protein